MIQLGLKIFGKFAGENFVVGFSVVKELRLFECNAHQHSKVPWNLEIPSIFKDWISQNLLQKNANSGDK